MGLENIVVCGNGSVDAHIQNVTSLDIKDNKVLIEVSGQVIEIQVRDGPIIPGGKYTATVLLRDKLVILNPTLNFGGGGYNSLMEILELYKENGLIIPNGNLSPRDILKVAEELSRRIFKVYYVDMSSSGIDIGQATFSLKRELHENGAEPYFIGGRQVPLNLVLNERANKIIIKSPIDYQGTQLTELDEHHIRSILQRSKGILVNSLKDESLVNLISQCSTKSKVVLSVLTRSLPAPIVYDRLVPHGITIFNYDEFGEFMRELGITCFGPEPDEDKKIEYAISGIKEISYDIRNRPIFVTLGKNGTLCSDAYDIYHVHLKDDILQKVGEDVNRQVKTTCGAGDRFAGAVFYYYMTAIAPDVVTAGKEGCRRAVKYLGFKDRISDNDFIIAKVSGIKKAA